MCLKTYASLVLEKCKLFLKCEKLQEYVEINLWLLRWFFRKNSFNSALPMAIVFFFFLLEIHR